MLVPSDSWTDKWKSVYLTRRGLQRQRTQNRDIVTTSTDTIQDCFMQCNILSLSMFLFRVVHQTHFSLCFCLSRPPNTSPLPQNILLFYSDCCVDTYYPDPDHLHWCLPLFNHITSRVMWYCSFAIWSQFDCAFTPTRLCLYFTNTPLLCNCLFPPCPCFAFTIAHLWAVFFHFSDFGRIHLKFLLPFHIVPSFHVPCILLPALVFIHVPRLI